MVRIYSHFYNFSISDTGRKLLLHLYIQIRSIWRKIYINEFMNLNEMVLGLQKKFLDFSLIF